MEPVTLSLMALSASGMALRRATDPSRVVIEFPAHRIDVQPRASVLSALAAGLRKRKLFAPRQRDMLHALARFAATQGLRIDMQVSLAGLFETGDDDLSPVASALRQRRIDVVFSDMEGTPLCGVELPAGRGPAHRDAVRRRAFAAADLPLMTLYDDKCWDQCRVALMDVLGGGLDAADDELPAEELLADDELFLEGEILVN